MAVVLFFFFNDTATTEIYTLSLHDALPISQQVTAQGPYQLPGMCAEPGSGGTVDGGPQRRVFCSEPAECVLGGGELVHDDPRLCRAQREWIKIRRHHRRGAVPGVQIVVQHPADGRVPVL